MPAVGLSQLGAGDAGHPPASQYLALERGILGAVLPSALPGCWCSVFSGFPLFAVFSVAAALIFLGLGQGPASPGRRGEMLLANSGGISRGAGGETNSVQTCWKQR